MKHEVIIYNQTRSKVPEKFILDVILRTFDFLKLKQPAELAVLVVDSNEIKRLNKIWRRKDQVVDELSFGLNSRKSSRLAIKQNKVLELGEIVISSEKIRDKKYLITILIHSLLHLLGYDHEKSTVKAKKMEHLEEKILNNL